MYEIFSDMRFLNNKKIKMIIFHFCHLQEIIHNFNIIPKYIPVYSKNIFCMV